jgi:leucyl-tRNA synthetase
MSSTSDSTTSEPQHAFRYTGALAQEIEPRWQDWWDEHGTFHTANPSGPLGDASVKDQPKLFVLDMFPYPSGTGLHVGHPLGFIGTDVYSRFKRMTGHNVLYTMGFDAFGLPAEQFAVQTGQHPAVTTAENVANMRRQLRRIGLSHDPRRSIDTTDPAYYRWTQWIFSQIFNAWYDTDRKRARPISELVDEFAAGRIPQPRPTAEPWAELDALASGPTCSTATAWPTSARRRSTGARASAPCVANEEVTADGRSDRGNFPVFKRNMRQWMMRITAYADRLVDDLDLLDWTDSIKAMQRNWIGRSEGAASTSPRRLVRSPSSPPGPTPCSAPRSWSLAPEHPLVDAH